MLTLRQTARVVNWLFWGPLPGPRSTPDQQPFLEAPVHRLFSVVDFLPDGRGTELTGRYRSLSFKLFLIVRVPVLGEKTAVRVRGPFALGMTIPDCVMCARTRARGGTLFRITSPRLPSKTGEGYFPL